MALQILQKLGSQPGRITARTHIHLLSLNIKLVGGAGPNMSCAEGMLSSVYIRMRSVSVQESVQKAQPVVKSVRDQKKPKQLKKKKPKAWSL